jgi:large subunit ribosomal protein L24
MKLKLNDMVKVMTGKDKGKTGKITKVIPTDNKVIVAGINQYKRHMKKRDAQNPGGVVEVERPIDVAKVMLLVGDKVTRVGYTVTKTGEKIRVAKKTNEPVDKK